MNIPFCPLSGTTHPSQRLQQAPSIPAQSAPPPINKKNFLPWMIVGAILIIALILTSSLTGFIYLGPPEKLTATYSTSSNLASNQMAFLVNNTGSVDIVIKEVQLHINATNLVLTATQLSGNSIPAGSATLMIATFLGVDFNGNFNIYFILTSTRGTHFPATCGPCTYTYVLYLNIVSATITITGSSVAFGLENSGTTDVVLSAATVTGGSYNNAAGTFPTATASSTVCGVSGGLATVPKGTSCTLTVTFTSGGSFVAGTTYSFKLISTQGHTYPYTTTA